MIANYLLTAWTSMVGSKKFIFKMSVEKTAALLFLTELIEARKLRPVIDRRYPMDQIVKPTATWKRGTKEETSSSPSDATALPATRVHGNRDC